MFTPLSEYLRVIEPFIPSDLISEEYITSIKKVTDFFPGQITSLFGFEIRLGNRLRGADFAFSIHPDVIPFLRDNFQDNFCFSLPESHKWERVVAFISEWSKDGSDLQQAVNLLCLEFDIEENFGNIPDPGFFISLETYLKKNRSKISIGRKREIYSSITGQTMELLKGRLFWRKIKPTFEKAVELLPGRSMLFQVGVMLSRKVEAIRLCIRGLNSEGILEFLKGMDWSGSFEELKEILDTCLSFSDNIVLAVDLGERLFPKVGIEVNFGDRKVPQGKPEWSHFLKYLIKQKLCNPEKGKGLLAYPGYQIQGVDFWPKNLLDASLFWGNSVFIRKLDHFKFVYQKDFPLEIKAYLAIYQNWLKKNL